MVWGATAMRQSGHITAEEVGTKYPQLLRAELEEDIANPRFREIQGFPAWDRHMTRMYGDLWTSHPRRREHVARGGTVPSLLMTSKEFERLSHRSASGFMSCEHERQVRQQITALGDNPESQRRFAVTMSEMWGLPFGALALPTTDADTKRAAPAPTKPRPKPRTRRFRQRPRASYWDEPAP